MRERKRDSGTWAGKRRGAGASSFPFLIHFCSLENEDDSFRPAQIRGLSRLENGERKMQSGRGSFLALVLSRIRETLLQEGRLELPSYLANHRHGKSTFHFDAHTHILLHTLALSSNSNGGLWSC